MLQTQAVHAAQASHNQQPAQIVMTGLSASELAMRLKEGLPASAGSNIGIINVAPETVKSGEVLDVAAKIRVINFRLIFVGLVNSIYGVHILMSLTEIMTSNKPMIQNWSFILINTTYHT